MVGEVLNITSFPQIEEGMRSLAFFFKVIGGVIGLYVIFWAINAFLNARKNKVLKGMLVNLQEINKKLSGVKVIKK